MNAYELVTGTRDKICHVSARFNEQDTCMLELTMSKTRVTLRLYLFPDVQPALA